MNKSDLKEQKTKYQLKIRCYVSPPLPLNIHYKCGTENTSGYLFLFKILNEIGQFHRTRKFRANIKLEVVAKGFINKIIRSEADGMNVSIICHVSERFYNCLEVCILK